MSTPKVCVILFCFATFSRTFPLGSQIAGGKKRVGNENNQRSNVGSYFNRVSYEGNERFLGRC